MKSFTVTRRCISFTVSEGTDEIDKIVQGVLDSTSFKNMGLKLEPQLEQPSGLKEDRFTVSLGDAQEDEACQRAYYLGKALEKAFAKIRD